MAEVLELQVHAAGALEVLLRAEASELKLAVEDELGGFHEIVPVREVIGRDVRLNLIQAKDATVRPWRLKGDTDAVLGDSTDPAFMLQGQQTCYLQLRSPKSPRAPKLTAVVGFVDPATGGPTPITPGGHHRFEVLTGLQGGAAELVVTLFDDAGRQVDILRRQASPKKRGGRRRADFDALVLAFTAPREARALSAVLNLTSGEPDADNTLLITAPSLSEGAESGASDRPVLQVTRQALSAIRRPGLGESSRLRLPLPLHLLDGQPHRLTLHVWAGEERLAIPDIDFAFRKAAHIGKYRFDTSGGLRVSGRATDHGAPSITLQLTVDGEPSTVATLKCSDGKFDGPVMAADRHLDGRAHVLEVRDAATQAPYCSAQVTLPRHTMLFSALQSHSRPPLSPGAAPALPHHRRAYAKWARCVARGATAPDLPALHAELLAGIRRRSDYAPLRFKEAATPRVSVIMPAHNKFEVTYFGLCALLFAANDADFEVIVVDDGSTDRTAMLEDIVEGVRVVRHDRAQGFVAACNDGAAAARGQYLAFLNNDTEATAGWLDEALAVFDGFEKVGLVGCKLVYPDGRLQEAGGVVWGTGDPWNVGRSGKANDPAFNYLRQVDYASGAAILLPRAVWEEVGGFSAEYAPAYFEDTDLAMKVRQSGRRVVYAPGALVYHHEGQSAGVDTTSGMKRFQEVNRPKFKRRWRHLYAGHQREVGKDVGREKDRGVALRVLLVDRAFPDAATPQGYKAFQLLRGLTAIGAKATLLPWELAWTGQVPALQRSGVECLHAPFVRDLAGYLVKAGADYDVIWINALAFAREVLGQARAAAPNARLIVDVEPLAGHDDELEPGPELDWLGEAHLLVSRGRFPAALALAETPRAPIAAGLGPKGAIGPVADSLRLALAQVELYGSADGGLVLKRDRPLEAA
jgi:GT2 family glycosyltransferase